MPIHKLMTDSADLKRPTDLDLHLFVKAGHILYRFSRSRVNIHSGLADSVDQDQTEGAV